MRIHLIFVLFVAIAGCTSNPTSRTQNTTFVPKDSQLLESGEQIYIADGFTYTTHKGPFNTPQEVLLLKGQYVARIRDEQGTYFKGAPGCVLLRGPEFQHMVRQFDGGLWIPDDARTLPAVFYVFGTDKVKVEADSVNSVAERLYLQNPSFGTIAGASIGAGLVGGIIQWLDGKISFAFQPGQDTWNELLPKVKRQQ